MSSEVFRFVNLPPQFVPEGDEHHVTIYRADDLTGLRRELRSIRAAGKPRVRCCRVSSIAKIDG